MAITQALRTELTTDPLALGYAGMSDTEILVSLYAETRSVLRALSHPELARVLAGGGRMAKLKRASEQWADDTKDAQTSIAIVALGFVSRSDSTLNPDNADDVVLINALVSTGILSAADRTAVVDAATHTVSRVVELGLGNVRLGDIQKARE